MLGERPLPQAFAWKHEQRRSEHPSGASAGHTACQLLIIALKFDPPYNRDQKASDCRVSMLRRGPE